MKSVTQCLQTSDIEALLDGTVATSQCDLWEEHVSSCDSCRVAMASRIGDEDWWREAEESLLGEFIPQGYEPASDAADDLKRDYSAKGHKPSGRSVDDHDSTAELLKLLGPTDDPRMMGRIGSYEILGVLGRGGMGIVFKAFDAPLNRYVAIKVLLPHLAASGAARKRFEREGQAAAAVIDDHVLPIYAVSQWQNIPYLVMRYSSGRNLQRRIDDDGQLDVKEILRIGVQAARGLAAAHAQGLVHRDVKPSNMLLDGSVERVTLADFGLARAVDDASITRTGTITGTPQYMSPEQAGGKSVDARSDLFSLGSVLYAMCVGRPPFRAENGLAILRLITDEEPRPIQEINPDIPDWLCSIISKLMSKQPEDRFASADDVAELLEDCLAHVQQPSTTSLPESVAKLARRQNRRPPIGKFIAAAAFAFTLILAGVLIVLEWNKGTLTIESEVDDIPIRVMQGDEVVEKLAVTKSGSSVRIAAGTYTIEVDGEFTGLSVVEGAVSLRRGKTETVRIVRSSVPEATEARDSVALDTDWLAALQGSWEVEIHSLEDANSRRDLMKAFVRGDRIEIHRPDGTDAMMFDIAIGTKGPPQEIDLKPVISDLERQELLQGFGESELIPHEVRNPIFAAIIERTGSAVRACVSPLPGAARPIHFTVGSGSAIWTFSKRDDVSDGGETVPNTSNRPLDPQHDDQSGTRTIAYRGQCVRAEDGVPIAGAVARFFIRGEKRSPMTLFDLTTTDKDGHFRFNYEISDDSEIDVARCQIAVTATGRASRVFFWQESSELTRIEMRPSASLKGRITDSASRPVAGARVRLGPNRMSGVNDAVTDQDGRFEIADLVKANKLDLESGISNVLHVEHPDGGETTAQVEFIPSTVNVVLKKTMNTTREMVPGGEWKQRDKLNAVTPEARLMDRDAARTGVDTLRRRWKLLNEAYKQGEVSLREVQTAARDLAEAEVAASESSDERRQAWQNLVNMLKQLKMNVEALHKTAEAGEADILAVEAQLQQAHAELHKAQAEDEKVPGVVDPRRVDYPYFTPRGPRDFRAANPPGRKTIPGTVDSQSKAMPVEIVLPHRFRLHWPGAKSQSPTTARFAVPVSGPSQIRLDEIIGHHGLEIGITIEPTDYASSDVFLNRETGMPIKISAEDLAALKANNLWTFKYEEEQGTVIAVIKITAQQRPVTPIADIKELEGKWRLVDADLVSDQPRGLPFHNLDGYKSARIAIGGTEWLYTRAGNELFRKLEAIYDLKACPQTVDLKYAAGKSEQHERRLFELHGDILITARRVSGTPEFPASFDETMVLIEQYQRVGVVMDQSEVDEHTVSISLGTSDGIRPDQQLQVSDGSSVLGTVEVTTIGGYVSNARVLQWSADRPIRKGDRVTPIESRDDEETPETSKTYSRENRWEVRYPNDPKQFGRALDYFGVELGSADGDTKEITYLSSLSAGELAVRRDLCARESRLFLTEADSESIHLAKTYLDQAGIETRVRLVMWFYSEETAQLLADLEAKHAAGKPIELVEKTVFGVRPKEDGFEFYVISQSENPTMRGAAASASINSKLAEIFSQAHAALMSIETLQYRFEKKDDQGWQSRAEFYADHIRFRVNRKDLTGIMSLDDDLKPIRNPPMTISSAFDGQKQQYARQNEPVRVKHGRKGGSYGITIPQVWAYGWLRDGAAEFHWDTILSKELWEQRFQEAIYIGDVTEDGRRFEIVDFPQRLEQVTPCIYRVYFARDLAFLPLKIFRNTLNRNEPSTTIHVTRFKTFTVNGKQIAIPLDIQHRETQADGVSHKGETTITVDESSLKVNYLLDDSLFTLNDVNEPSTAIE